MSFLIKSFHGSLFECTGGAKTVIAIALLGSVSRKKKKREHFIRSSQFVLKNASYEPQYTMHEMQM